MYHYVTTVNTYVLYWLSTSSLEGCYGKYCVTIFGKHNNAFASYNSSDKTAEIQHKKCQPSVCPSLIFDIFVVSPHIYSSQNEVSQLSCDS